MLLRGLAGILTNGGLLLLIGYLQLATVSFTLSTFFIGGLILALANTIIKPLLRLLALPLLFLTMGLFSLVINGLTLWFTSYVISVVNFSEVIFQIPDFQKFVLATLLFSIVNFLVDHSLFAGLRRR